MGKQNCWGRSYVAFSPLCISQVFVFIYFLTLYFPEMHGIIRRIVNPFRTRVSGSHYIRKFSVTVSNDPRITVNQSTTMNNVPRSLYFGNSFPLMTGNLWRVPLIGIYQGPHEGAHERLATGPPEKQGFLTWSAHESLKMDRVLVLQELAAVAKQRRAAESLLTIDLKEETLSTVISRAIAMLPLHSSVCRSVRQATLVSWPFYASLSVYPVDLEVGQASEADLTGYNRWCRKKAENFAQACSFFKSRRKVSRGE